METEIDNATGESATAPDSLDEALGADGQLVSEIQAELGSHEDMPAQARSMVLDELHEVAGEGGRMSSLDSLAAVEVEVTVEFGRRRMPIRELMSLHRGSLIELAREPDQQVTVLANGTVIAYGDIVLVGEQLGVHIVSLAEPGTKTPAAVTEPGPGVFDAGKRLESEIPPLDEEPGPSPDTEAATAQTQSPSGAEGAPG